MISYLQQHSTTTLMVAYIVFGAAVSSLPAPPTNCNLFYCWFYKFANALAANVTAIRGKAAFEEPPVQP